MGSILNNDQIERITKSLVRCDAMRHPSNRNSVIERLPNKISEGITRKEDAMEDAFNIVHRCAQFPDGMDALMKSVGFRDKGTTFFLDAERIWGSIKKSYSSTGETVKSNNIAEPIAYSNGENNHSDILTHKSPSKVPETSTDPSAQNRAGAVPLAWEKIAAFTFGVVFLIFMIIIAIIIKNPTPFQYRFFQIAMSLAAAGVGAVIPGLLQLEVNQKYTPLIRAGGAIALFVLIYLFNPKPL